MEHVFKESLWNKGRFYVMTWPWIDGVTEVKLPYLFLIPGHWCPIPPVCNQNIMGRKRKCNGMIVNDIPCKLPWVSSCFRATTSHSCNVKNQLPIKDFLPASSSSRSTGGWSCCWSCHQVAEIVEALQKQATATNGKWSSMLIDAAEAIGAAAACYRWR